MTDKKVTSFGGTFNEKAIAEEICAMRDVASALERAAQAGGAVVNLEARVLQELRELRQSAEKNYWIDGPKVHEQAEGALLNAVDPAIAEEFRALRKVIGWSYE